MSKSVRVSGSHRFIGIISVRVSGAWKTILEASVRVAGSWKLFYVYATTTITPGQSGKIDELGYDDVGLGSITDVDFYRGTNLKTWKYVVADDEFIIEFSGTLARTFFRRAENVTEGAAVNASDASFSTGGGVSTWTWSGNTAMAGDGDGSNDTIEVKF